MKAIPIAENIWWVGAIDWNAHHFHGQTFTTKRGTTYNAYLIVDEKIALIDTEGESAIDVFYLTDSQGAKLTHEAQEKLAGKMTAALEAMRAPARV